MAVKPKVITQHCLKGRFFKEVMKLPAKVKIVEIQFECGFAIKKMSQPIPTKLKGCGVTSIRKADPSFEVSGLLTGTREKMKKDIETICSELDLHENTAVRVRRLVVDVGKHRGTFIAMTKMLPTEDEKIAKVPVLGLIKWDSDENAIARACNADKFKCKYDIQTIRTVICEEG